MAKMINRTRAYLVLVLLHAFFCVRVATAWCCQSKSKNGLQSVDRSTWLSEVGTLDKLHVRWLKKTILSNLQVVRIPDEVIQWRKTRSVKTMVEQTQIDERRHAEAESNEYVVRQYSLKVIGRQVGKILNHSTQRRNHQTTHGHKGCAAHFEFVAKIAETGTYSNYDKTVLQKAEFQLPHDGTFNLHTHRGSTRLERMFDADVSDSDDERLHGRRQTRTVDVTSLLQSSWSPKQGANVTLTWHGRRVCRLYYQSDVDVVVEPILKLELKETRSKRAKRHVDVPPSRNRKRQDMIRDCESQWDLAFLNSTSVSLYDSIAPCCRRKVNVNFTELGWDQWVVAPLTFDSYYCMGRCVGFGGFATEDTDGASFYAELMNLQNSEKSLGLSPCCSPVKFSPLTITVLTGDNEEMTQTLEDVVVKQCGCM